MNVSLTPELEKLVRDKVESGLYQTASEVVRDSLRLLEERDRLRRLKLAELHREIRKGLDSGKPKAFNPEALKLRVRRAHRQRTTRPTR